jgi:hypothetical protein
MAVEKLRVVDGEVQVVEAGLAPDGGDQWGDEVRDEPGDQPRERCADDERDRQIDQVSAKQERLESTHFISFRMPAPGKPAFRDCLAVAPGGATVERAHS